MTPCLKIAVRPRQGRLARTGKRVRLYLSRKWRAYWEHKAQRAGVVFLSLLDDNALRDIGIGRSEIECLVYGQGRACRQARCR